MVATALQVTPIDRMARIHLIRAAFARSPLFRDAVISAPQPGDGVEVVLDVSFGKGPAVFRVVAGSEGAAYAILHELAIAMVEVDRSVVTSRPRPRPGASCRGPRAASRALEGRACRTGIRQARRA